MKIPEAVTTKEAATRLAVSEQRVRTLLRSGALEGRQFGKQWLTSVAAIERYLVAGATQPPEDRPRKPAPLPAIKALSFFSGAMGLDLGLEKAGIHFLLACESDKTCRRTISANRPDIALLGDIWNYDGDAIRAAAGLGPDDDIDVMVGGPPPGVFNSGRTGRVRRRTRQCLAALRRADSCAAPALRRTGKRARPAVRAVEAHPARPTRHRLAARPRRTAGWGAHACARCAARGRLRRVVQPV